MKRHGITFTFIFEIRSILKQTKNVFVQIILKPLSVSALFYHGTERITKRSKESEINPVVLHRPLVIGRPKEKKNIWESIKIRTIRYKSD